MAIIKPNNNTISAITALPAAISTGKVLQAVTFTTQTQSNTTSSSYQATALTKSITPASTSSKILVLVSFGFYAASGDSRATLYRDSTNLFDATKGMISMGSTDINVSTCTLDSPNTSSAVTYTIRIAAASGTAYFLPASNLTATMTLLEVGA